jgi:hypothetical protein
MRIIVEENSSQRFFLLLIPSENQLSVGKLRKS